jgi:predicted exporter
MGSIRSRFLAWLLVMALAGAYFALRVLPNLKLETDITAMLPQVSADPVLERLVHDFADQAGRRTLFLIGSADFGKARAAAEDFARTLRDSKVFADVTFAVDLDPQRIDSAYGPARRLLLSGPDRALLAAQRGAELGTRTLHALYTPAGLARARPFAEDPLNLYGDFLAELLPVFPRVQLRESVLTIEDAGTTWILVTALVDGSPFAIATQDRVADVLPAALASARTTGVDVLCSGVLQHAIAQSQRAAREISIFGSVSTLGVLLVLLIVFRSGRPMLLSFISLSIGAVISLIAAYVIFDRIHLLALVFGSSLIGVGVDYSLHFFADQFRKPEGWSGADALAHVGPAVSVGVATTALGYLAFLVPPFPGLRQMAVMSVAGVAGAALCVLCAYPPFAGRGNPHPPRYAIASMRRLAAVHGPRGRALAAWLTAAALLGLGLTRLQFVDDVRALQSSPPELLAQETQARRLLGGGLDSRFFLLEAPDEEQLLQREEALRARLDPLIDAGALGGYLAVSRALPSQARQAENERGLASQVYAADGALPRLYAALGYDPATAQRARDGFEAARGHYLAPANWLATPIAAGYRGLWLGPTGRGYASAIALSGVARRAEVQALDGAVPGVRFVDRLADISTVLKGYREIAQWGLVGALAAIGGILALRYGVRGAARHLLAPAGACVLTLATLSWLGMPINLFSILALLLVLGMGVDYTVFLEEGSETRTTTLFAITVAGAITLLSFGMLAVSSTPFIRSLGLSVLLGVAYTWLLALLASAPATPELKE